jgi:hypothetical protein
MDYLPYIYHMEKELKKAFYKAKYEGKPDLSLNIWNSIVVRNKRITRIKLWVFSFIGFSSLVGLIPAWKVLSNDLTQSGLYEYFSLVFSSGTSIFSYWKELSLSIAESLPIISIILSLSLVFILFLSLKYVTKQIIKNQLSLSF